MILFAWATGVTLKLILCVLVVTVEFSSFLLCLEYLEQSIQKKFERV